MIYVNTAPFIIGYIENEPVTLPTGSSFKFLGVNSHQVEMKANTPEEINDPDYVRCFDIVSNQIKIQIQLEIFNTFFKEIQL